MAITTTGQAGGAGTAGVARITEYFDTASANLLAGGVPAGGTAGQILKKNTGTDYDTSWTSVNYNQTAALSPTGVSSSTAVMVGSNLVITPARSGVIQVSFYGEFRNSVATGFTSLHVRWGTGTPPANGAAVTGTTGGAFVGGHSSAVNEQVPFAITLLVGGQPIGTACWFDLDQATGGAGTSNIVTMTGSVIEI
jgi:hypothetical protein